MPGRCHFNEKCLEKGAYKSWLRRHDKNSNKAFCFACKKSINLNVMGESAFVSHMKGKKHEEYVKNLQGNEKTTKINDFFSSSASTLMAQLSGNRQQQSTETLQAVIVTGPTNQTSQSIQSLLGSNATLKAEICWTLKVITSHYSLKSCGDISSIFKFMFHATFGIAPHC